MVYYSLYSCQLIYAKYLLPACNCQEALRANAHYKCTYNTTRIRVVNAFRQGLDSRYGEHSGLTLAEVLRKQSSLSKRHSQTSSLDYADNIPDELTIPEIDVERLSSHSHTETAV